MTKIGIIQEGKFPREKRVAFTPEQCAFIQKQFTGVTVVVQPSEWRCYTNDEYAQKGISLQENLSDCDILFGIKEVPKQELIPDKKYLFFSHTIKKQPHNRELLQTVLKNNIQLIDYECLTDDKLNRIIGFGYYAGLVGTYNGILGYGKKYKLFDLKPAHLCYDKNELKQELTKAHLPNIKIIITGNGRVANGAIELMGMLGVRRITLRMNFCSFILWKQPMCSCIPIITTKNWMGMHGIQKSFMSIPKDFVPHLVNTANIVIYWYIVPTGIPMLPNYLHEKRCVLPNSG
jgi:saccharopine dehydrogenase (NAD+, L-lysine forming)